MKTLKVMLVAAVLMVVGMPAMAMQFEQPEEIGGLQFADGGVSPHGKGVTFKRIDEKDERGNDLRGEARYGGPDDGMYVYFNRTRGVKSDERLRVGGPHMVDTYPIDLFELEVYRMRSDGGITFYFVEYNFRGDPLDWKLFGRRADGRFVKYFNTKDLRKAYFGEGRDPWFNTPYADGDTVVIPYRKAGKISWEEGMNPPFGEFRFRWDEDAQWFGVENVPY